MLDSALRYRLVSEGIERQAKASAPKAATPKAEIEAGIKSDEAYYKKRMAEIRTPDELVADERMLQIVLRAFDLSGALGAKTLIRDILKEGYRDGAKTNLEGDVVPIKARVNTMADRRFLALTAALDFKLLSSVTMQHPTVMKRVLDGNAEALRKPKAPPALPGVDQKTERDPEIRREAAYYLANIGKVKTLDQFLQNYRLYSFAMKAFGLDDMIDSRGFMRRVLREGVADKNAFALKLEDERFATFAAAFNFKDYGADATKMETARDPVVARYKRSMMEANEGESNPAVRLALNFRRRIEGMTFKEGAPAAGADPAPSATKARRADVLSLLAEPALAEVLRTSLGMSREAAMGSLEKQVEQIGKRVNVAELKRDPKKLTQLIERFLMNWDLQNAAPENDPATLLFSDASDRLADNGPLIAALQTLRLGGR